MKSAVNERFISFVKDGDCKKMDQIHFISGLPRSGSTLIAALLRQNPRFHASISSPVAGMIGDLLMGMGPANPFSSRMTDDQRYRILRAIFDAYYADVRLGAVVLDTNRRWCAMLPILVRMFPSSRIICCLRSPAWILDSLERQFQQNAVKPAKLFGHDSYANVYHRVEALMRGGFVGRALGGLKQAWFGEHATNLVAVRYESLAAHPNAVIEQLYYYLQEATFEHDFENLRHDEPEFDSELGLPGFHRVLGPVKFRKRIPILPPDLFAHYDQSFWDGPDQNPRGIPVL